VWCGSVHQVLFVLTSIVNYFLIGLQLMMFIRAILSWIMPEDDNPLVNFVVAVTEPVIYPVRLILDRFEFFAGMPFDISFFVAFFLISILQNILPII